MSNFLDLFLNLFHLYKDFKTFFLLLSAILFPLMLIYIMSPLNLYLLFYMLLVFAPLTCSLFWFWFCSWSWFQSCHLHTSSPTKAHAVPGRRLGSSWRSCNDRLETFIRVVTGWSLGSTPQPDFSGGLKTKRVAKWSKALRLNKRCECWEACSTNLLLEL